jgi:hypothetical protein
MGRMGTSAVRSAIVVLALLVQGCWWQSGQGPGKTGFNTEATVTAANVADLEVAWTASLPAGVSEPIVADGSVLVRSTGTVTALRTTTGALRWSVGDLGGRAAPAVAGNRLWLGTSGPSCGLVALNLTSGAQVSSGQFGGGPPISFGGSSFCALGDLLSARSKLLATWVYFASVIAPRSCGGQPTNAFGHGAVATDYATTGGVWNSGSIGTNCPGDPPPPPAEPARPLSSDGALVFRSLTTGVVAYALADCGAGSTITCQPAWTATLGDGVLGTVVVLAGGALAVPMVDGRVVVLDAATGAVRWTAMVGAPLSLGVAASRSTLLAVATDGTVAAFPVAGCGTATCTPAWTATLPAPASARPSIGGDVAYIGATDGSVTALPAEGCGAATCTSLWSASVGANVVAAPAIDAGTLYVPTNTTLTAFRLPPP